MSVRLYSYGQVMCFPIGYMGGASEPLPGRSPAHTRLTCPVQAKQPDNNIISGLGHKIRGPEGPGV